MSSSRSVASARARRAGGSETSKPRPTQMRNPAQFQAQADDNKGNIEITLEIVLQVSLMFLGIFFIHRIIEFIPTYSGVSYPEFKVVYIILAVMMITLSLQTKLGEKVSILSKSSILLDIDFTITLLAIDEEFSPSDTLFKILLMSNFCNAISTRPSLIVTRAKASETESLLSIACFFSLPKSL